MSIIRSLSVLCNARRAAGVATLFLACMAADARLAQAEPLRTDNPAALGAGKKKYPEFEEARKLLLKQDVDGALEVLNAAAAAHSELASGRVLLASIYYASNRAADGRVMLEKAVVETPDDPEPYLFMADQALRERQWTIASMLSEKAVVLSQAYKGDAERKKDLQKRALLIAGTAAKGREDWETSRKALSALVKLAPSDAAGHFQLGCVLFELKKDKEAYAELQAAARLDEDLPSAESTMGHLWDSAKDRAKAEEWMKRAVKTDGKKLNTRLDVAKWLFNVRRFDEAKEQIDEALLLDSDSQEALFWAGRIARFAKNNKDARRFLEKAYLQAPGSTVVANELALALGEISEEDRKRAFSLAQATFNQNKNNPESAATLGWICYQLGRTEEAEQLLTAVAGTNQVTPDAIFYYATLADARNRGDVVKPYLEVALKNEAPFAYRDEAQQLLDRLNKTSPGEAKETATKPAKSGTKAAPTSSTPGATGAKKTAAAKSDAPKADAPKADAPKTDAPKAPAVKTAP